MDMYAIATEFLAVLILSWSSENILGMIGQDGDCGYV
jgi:hypothetical protein